MSTTAAATTGTYSEVGRPGAYGLRHRCLSSFEVLSQSIAVIAPSASMAAIIPLVFVSSGPSTWLAYLVTGIGLALVALNINAFAKRSASPGSLYSYTARALGTNWGVMVGWGWLVAYICCGVALAGAAANFMLLLFGSPGGIWPYVAYGVAVLVPWYIAYRDIRLSAKMMLILEFSSMILIGIVVLAVFARSGPAVYAPQFTLQGFTFNGLFLGMVLAIFANIGFESSTALGEEAKNPLVTIPRAVMGAVVVAAIFYVLGSLAMIGAFSASHTTLDGNANALLTMSTYVGASWAAPLLTIMVLVSSMACTLGSFNAGSRVLFAMGRHGIVHGSMGEAHKDHETPHISVTVCAAIALVGGWLSMRIWGLGPTDLLNDGGTFSAYGYLVGFVLIAIAAPVYLKSQKALTPPALVISALTLIFLLVPIIGQFYPAPTPPTLYFPYVFAAYMAAGGAWLYIQRRKSNAVVKSIEADLEDIGVRYGMGKENVIHGSELDGIAEVSVGAR
ncbi:MAG TPA: APC family permease [Candidatus Acidoferrales bacterium]|nr:APC family permease [Candidatus Acidoferrales bacterium]